MRPTDATASAHADVNPGPLQAWSAALRPRSLPVAVAPVLAGSALAYLRNGAIDGTAALLALGAALSMQLVTNLQNDVGYTLRGGDASGTRTGLPRATAKGWLGVRAVRGAIVALALLGVALGLALAARRGWPVLAVGAASLAAALAYMGGPRPIAYTPLGELTVFLFFGLVAVACTDWVVSGAIGGVTWMGAMAVGSLAAAALAVNNHRDIAHDREVGRRTFAVCFGVRASQRLFAALLFAPFALLPAMALAARAPALLLPALLLPTALRLHRDFVSAAAGRSFNAVLFGAFRLGLWFACALAIGAVLARMLSS